MDRTSELNALLQSDLSEVPTEIPLINATTELALTEAKIEDKKDKTGSNLNLVFTLTSPVQSVDGKEVSPGAFGSKFFHTVSLRKTEKYNPAENLARLRQALTGSKAGAFGPPEQYIGTTVMAVLKPDMNEQFGNRTVIGRFIKKG